MTLPFKQKIINLTDKIVNDAESTGSANTILLDNEGVVGENTDVFGLQAAYLKEFNCKGKKKRKLNFLFNSCSWINCNARC